MLINRKSIKFIPLILLTLGACQNNNDRALEEVALNSSWQHFETAFFSLKPENIEQKLSDLKKEYPPFFREQTDLAFWEKQRRDSLQQALYEISQKVFNQWPEREARLNRAMKRYYFHFGKRDTLEFYTYISALDFNYPTLYAKPFCFSALDLYLGPDQAFYQAMPRYLRYNRQPKFLLPDAISAIVEGQSPPPVENAHLLDAMIYHGKILFVTHQLLPELPLHDLLKYPEEKMAFAREHEREMWLYFIENQLLFKRSENLKARFINLAPFSKFRTHLDKETPGRIGIWYGYLLVKNYFENAEPSLPELLAEKNSRKILNQAGYKP